MGAEAVALWLVGLVVGLIVIGLPLAYAIILGAFGVMFIHGGVNPLIAPQRLFAGLDSFSLLAVPLFLLAGSLMATGGISDRLIAFANALVGRFTGGLAISNVLSSILFGGISGSAVADTSAIGRTYIPAMATHGYSRAFSVGITAASSPISPLVPPSIAWIVYAFLTDQSVIRMFVAGIVPGILWGIALMVGAYIIAKRRGYPTAPSAGASELLHTFIDALPALATPLIILVGILAGIFTVTEAAAVAVVYALAVSGLVYRELTFAKLYQALKESARLTAAVLIILAAANLFAWMLAFTHFPARLEEVILATITSPLAFLLAVNVLLLVVGMVMEVNAAKVMLLPVLFPLALSFGIDPIHFGVIITVNLCIGLITPPVGIVLAIAAKVGDTSIEDATRGILPLLALALAVLVLVTLVPAISTGLPDLLLGPPPG